MKNLLTILFGVLLMWSCQDDGIPVEATISTAPQQTTPGSTFLVFSSKKELAETLSEMKSGKLLAPAKVAQSTASSANFSTEKPQFVSLLEANKKKVMATLSAAQLDSINNDEDELEFCLTDSIIADYEFAQLLNASRTIEVNDTVYKYYENGVAFTDHTHARQLEKIDAEVSQVPVTDKSVGTVISIYDNVKFIPNTYGEVKEGENNSYSSASSNTEPIVLNNGITIPTKDIRDVDYNSKGDGGWFHRAWNGIWGKNVLAIKKINKHKRIRLGLYDQNYIVYANIGTTVKMQKKVCGIWWNCKADEIRIGWSAIELRHTFPSPITTYFNPNTNTTEKREQPAWFRHNFPFKNENTVLFYIPFTSYNIKVKTVNSLLKSGITSLINKGTKEVKNLINATPENQRGLFSANNSNLYLISGADEFGKTRTKTLDKKFNATWLDGTYEIAFAYNGSFSLRKISMKKCNCTKLSSAVVYGAVKYKGQWVAARITKTKEKE